jgi:hypothetical protein
MFAAGEELVGDFDEGVYGAMASPITERSVYR